MNSGGEAPPSITGLDSLPTFPGGGDFRGGAIDDWHLLGGKGGGIVGNVLGAIKMDQVGSLIISNSLA